MNFKNTVGCKVRPMNPTGTYHLLLMQLITLLNAVAAAHYLPLQLIIAFRQWLVIGRCWTPPLLITSHHHHCFMPLVFTYHWPSPLLPTPDHSVYHHALSITRLPLATAHSLPSPPYLWAITYRCRHLIFYQQSSCTLATSCCLVSITSHHYFHLQSYLILHYLIKKKNSVDF